MIKVDLVRGEIELGGGVVISSLTPFNLVIALAERINVYIVKEKMSAVWFDIINRKGDYYLRVAVLVDGGKVDMLFPIVGENKSLKSPIEIDDERGFVDG